MIRRSDQRTFTAATTEVLPELRDVDQAEMEHGRRQQDRGAGLDRLVEWSSVPAPPEATIRALVACFMARMIGRSYPVLAPSPALLVAGSPARRTNRPSSPTRRVGAGRRAPPSMYTS